MNEKNFEIVEKTPVLFKLRIFHPQFSRRLLVPFVIFLGLSVLVIIVLILADKPWIQAVFSASPAFFFSIIFLIAYLSGPCDTIVLINRQEKIVQREIYYRTWRITTRRSMPFASIIGVYYATATKSASCALKLETASFRRTIGLFFALPFPEYKQWEAYFRELFARIPFTSEVFQEGNTRRAV